MMNWRGGALLLSCISCLHGRAAMEELSIFTLQTVSIPLGVHVRMSVLLVSLHS